jgi:CubicO group peptidase (beta-lactamase class C family)
MTLATCALLLALAAPAAPTATAPPSARVDTTGDGPRSARLNDYVDRLDAFGFSGQILVEERGRILLDRSCGLADRRFGVSVIPATIFGIGSVTKTFTAAAILRLCSEGRLKVTDRLSAHLEGVPRDKRGITLDQLLSHRAGLLPDADLPDSSSREDVVRRILAQPLAFPPGQRFSYSNIGFDLLAAVIEHASGADYDTFVRREFLVPAGMDHTGRAGARALALLPAARGENEWGEASALTEWPRAWHGTGAGRMVSNAHDLLRWTHALSDGVVMSPAERDLMFAEHAIEPDSSASYGYGMRLETLANGARLRMHGGDVPGYRTEMRMYPDAGRVVIVTTNQDLWALGVQRRTIANTLSRLAQGIAPPNLPPDAVLPGLAERAIGAWLLPGGGRIDIWARGGRLRLSATGQDAVDCFEADPRDSTGARARALERTRALVTAAIANDSTVAHAMLEEDEYDLGWPFLRHEIETLTGAFGAIDSVAHLGATTLPFEGFGTRAYFQLKLADGVRGAYIGWLEGKLFDVTFGDERPAPTLLPVAPLRSGGYAAFDMIRGRAMPFRVTRAPDGALELRLPAGSGEVVARKLR